MAKQQKYNLVFEQDYNYDLLGICTYHSDYRLVWGLNTLLGIQLEKSEIDDLFVVSSKKSTGRFPFYHHKDESEFEMDYYLIKNKHEGKFLIPEKQQVDYFLFLLNNQLVDCEDWLQKMKSHPSVIMAFQFFPEELPSAENIVF